MICDSRETWLHVLIEELKEAFKQLSKGTAVARCFHEEASKVVQFVQSGNKTGVECSRG
jgi:hypothetical protein